MKRAERNLILNVVALVAAVMLPSVVLSAVDWKDVAGIASLAAVTCFIAGTLADWRVALWLAVPLAVASALGFAWAHNPWLAAILMAIIAGARGVATKWGLSGALTTAPISVAFLIAQPPEPSSRLPDVIFVGLVVLAAGLYATLMVYLLRNTTAAIPKTPPLASARAWAYGILLGVLVGVATWFVVYFKLGHPGGWIVLTLIIVLQPYVKDGLAKAMGRAGGTVLGFLIALGVGSITHSPVIISLSGMVAMIIAIVVMAKGSPYWQFACMLTVAIVLFSGANSSVEQLAYDRLWATLIGVAAAVIVIALLDPISKRYAQKVGEAKF